MAIGSAGGRRLPGRATPTALLIGALLSACAGAGRFEVVMQDSSMEPTFRARTTLVFQSATGAERGQVIAFEYPFPYPGNPRRELIARVIGLPGDEIVLDSQGIRVNGGLLEEPYAKNQQQVSAARLIVPAESYFVLGDDRNNQRDSRWWGPLPASKLLGVFEQQE